MYEIAHVYGQDLQISPSGDLALASGDNATQQRIIRRLLTALGDYIWELDYGAGLPAFVGIPTNATAIAAVIRSQIALEATVAASPEPVVSITADDSSNVSVDIQYVDATTGQTQVLNLPLGA